MVIKTAAVSDYRSSEYAGQKIKKDNVGDHDRQKEILRLALKNKRLAHAYLFEGPDGVGKKLMALALALVWHMR